VVPDDDGAVAPNDVTTAPSDAWGWWILRWFGAMLATVTIAGAVFVTWHGGPLAVLWLIMGSAIIGLAVGAMTLVASLLRWLLGWCSPPRLQRAIVPVVVLGAIAGPLVLFSSFAVEDPRVLLEPARADLGMVFAGPLVLGGGLASYLAERRVSPRRPWWWMAVVAAAGLGLLLFAP
jgi:hypothetical protein